jgi:hypothetical protein
MSYRTMISEHDIISMNHDLKTTLLMNQVMLGNTKHSIHDIDPATLGIAYRYAQRINKEHAKSNPDDMPDDFTKANMEYCAQFIYLYNLTYLSKLAPAEI